MTLSPFRIVASASKLARQQDRPCDDCGQGALSACGKVDRLATTSSTVPFDYQKRHPIALVDAPFVTKVYPSNRGLSTADKERIADLARALRQGWPRSDYGRISLARLFRPRRP